MTNPTNIKDHVAHSHYDASLRKPSRMTEFLWECAGADKQILEHCTYADSVKYASLGGFVFVTGVMAVLSGGFAFWYIFGNVIAAVVFGLFWGLCIFNIDRFIISSTGKGDGTDQVTWAELKNALPRIVMGVILGFVISKPLELKMFEPEIQHAIDAYKSQEAVKGGDNFTKENAMKLTAMQTQRAEAFAAYKAAKDNVDLYNKKAQEESDNPARPGTGPRYKEAMKKVETYQKEADAKEAEYKDLDKQLAELEAKLKAHQEQSKQSADEGIGLMKRLDILHEIGGLIPWIISCVFIIIEITPIFFKLMMIKSPYDYLDENHKEIIVARHGVQRKGKIITKFQGYDASGAKIEQSEELSYDIYHLAENHLKEKVKLLDSELDIKHYIIDKHIHKKKKEIDDNPEKFIEPDEPENKG